MKVKLNSAQPQVVLQAPEATVACVGLHRSERTEAFALGVLPLDGALGVASSPLSFDSCVGSVVFLEAGINYAFSVLEQQEAVQGEYCLSVQSQYAVSVEGAKVEGKKKRNFPSRFAQGVKEEQRRQGRQNPHSFVEQVKAQRQVAWECLVQLCMLSWNLPSPEPDPQAHPSEEHVTAAQVALSVLHPILLPTQREAVTEIEMWLPLDQFFDKLEAAEEQFGSEYMQSQAGHEVLCKFREWLQFDYEKDQVYFAGALQGLSALVGMSSDTDRDTTCHTDKSVRAQQEEAKTVARDPTPIVL